MMVVVAQDRGEPVDQVAPILARGPAVELRAQDLGAALEEAPEEREVLAFGEAIVASLAERVKTDPGRRLGEGVPPFHELRPASQPSLLRSYGWQQCQKPILPSYSIT